MSHCGRFPTKTNRALSDRGPWPTTATRTGSPREFDSHPTEQVRQWADRHGVDIIHEFEDAGKSGLNAEGRPGFTTMMNDWVKQRKDFAYVICLDVSRWGRFQDLDLSAEYSAACKKHGKQVVYTNIGMRPTTTPSTRSMSISIAFVPPSTAGN